LTWARRRAIGSGMPDVARVSYSPGVTLSRLMVLLAVVTCAGCCKETSQSGLTCGSSEYNACIDPRISLSNKLIGDCDACFTDWRAKRAEKEDTGSTTKQDDAAHRNWCRDVVALKCLLDEVPPEAVKQCDECYEDWREVRRERDIEAREKVRRLRGKGGMR